jgi:hypothetical protein
MISGSQQISGQSLHLFVSPPEIPTDEEYLYPFNANDVGLTFYLVKGLSPEFIYLILGAILLEARHLCCHCLEGNMADPGYRMAGTR